MPEVYRDLLTCVVCDKGGGDIKKCAKCFSVSYCGRECQVGDWGRHKRLCHPVMIKDFGEKGRGLVASKNFSVGDLILKDKSVVCLSTSITPFECYGYEYAEQIFCILSTKDIHVTQSTNGERKCASFLPQSFRQTALSTQQRQDFE